jgi:hypothetical protein
VQRPVLRFEEPKKNGSAAITHSISTHKNGTSSKLYPHPTSRKTHPNLWHTVCGKSLSVECAAFRDLQYLGFFVPQLDLVTVGGKLIFFGRWGRERDETIRVFTKSLYFDQHTSNVSKTPFLQKCRVSSPNSPLSSQ